MSLQWTLVAGFLYLEVFITLLLVLPVASPQRWNRLLNSSFVKTLRSQSQWYFYLILVILVLFLLDAIREMRKYSNLEASEHHGHAHLETEMQTSMRLFRAQRNFYISGFALFLSVVIRRILHLLTTQANLIAQSEAALKQAQGASAAARSILTKEKTDGLSSEAYEKQIKELKESLKSAEEKYNKNKQDRDALKSQAESVTKEYDRLLDEHRKLQESVSASGDKKRE